jgi:hypothetical protein
LLADFGDTDYYFTLQFFESLLQDLSFLKRRLTHFLRVRPTKSISFPTHIDDQLTNCFDFSYRASIFLRFLGSSSVLQKLLLPLAIVPGVAAVRSSGRCRDAFPIPLIEVSNSDSPDALLARITNFAILALNSMHGIIGKPRITTAVHRSINSMLLRKSGKLYKHLDNGSDFASGHTALEILLGIDPDIAVGSKAYAMGDSVRLRAADVDLLERPGLADPIPYLPPSVSTVVLSLELLFRGAPPHRLGFRSIGAQDHAEYCKLVYFQLKSRKVDLAFSVNSGGTIFPVGKKGSRKVREVAPLDR